MISISGDSKPASTSAAIGAAASSWVGHEVAQEASKKGL
jgi:hypothetical protein